MSAGLGDDMLTCAEAIVALLADAGVGRIFAGVGGDELVAAAVARGLDVVRTARAAAIMAATEGELVERPGVCVVGRGAGCVSAIEGVAHARLDRAPLLVLADRAPRASLRLAARQSLDQLQLFEAVTKSGAPITAPRAERLLAWAWARALQPPQGPVHLDLPADQLTRRARIRGALGAPRPATPPSPHAVRSVARQLVRRGRAVTVAGLHCRAGAAAPALLELIEHLGTPTFSTQKAKGVIPEDHPLAAGVFAGAGPDEELLAKADTVLAVGLDSVELLPRPWRAGVPVIVIGGPGGDPRPYRTATEIGGDVVLALEALRAESPPGGEWSLAGWAGRGGEFKAQARTRLRRAERGAEGDLPAHRILEVAREVAPRDAIVAVDPGLPSALASVFWEAYDRSGYLCSSGLGVAGYAIPAALAARLTLPQRPVLAVTEQAGLLLSLEELGHAAARGVPLTVLVLLARATGGSVLDLGRLAEGLGIPGTEVAAERALRAALEESAGGTRPALIGIRLPERAAPSAAPPVEPSGAASEGP